MLLTHFKTDVIYYCLFPSFGFWYTEFHDKIEIWLSETVCTLFAASEKQVFSSQSEYFEQIPALKCKWICNVCIVWDKAVNNELILALCSSLSRDYDQADNVFGT